MHILDESAKQGLLCAPSQEESHVAHNHQLATRTSQGNIGTTIVSQEARRIGSNESRQDVVGFVTLHGVHRST